MTLSFLALKWVAAKLTKGRERILQFILTDDAVKIIEIYARAIAFVILLLWVIGTTALHYFLSSAVRSLSLSLLLGGVGK